MNNVALTLLSRGVRSIGPPGETAEPSPLVVIIKTSLAWISCRSLGVENTMNKLRLSFI